MFLSITKIFPYCETVVRNAKFANKLLIINAIPGRMYEAEACGTTPLPQLQFVQQKCSSYSLEWSKFKPESDDG